MQETNISKSNIIGVVVLYFPDNSLLKNIESYQDSVHKLILIDNTDNPDFIYPFDVNQFLENVIFIKNNENIGIAAALNIAAKLAYNSGYEYILTMDQDSTLSVDCIEVLKNVISSFKEKDKIAIVAPFNKITDKRYELDKNVSEVLSVITSGNIVNLSLLKEINFYDEKLFIDYVDHDIGIRFNLMNFKVLICYDALFDHILGELKSVNKNRDYFNSSHHSATRRYYITRNRFYLMNKHKKQFPSYYSKEFKAFIKETIKIVIFERDKINKIKMTFRGYIDFRRGKFGKLII